MDVKRLAAPILILALFAAEATAADARRIRALNVGGQALMTLVSGVIQKNIHSPGDVVRCLASGSAAGYGAYEAKILVSDGHVQQGWLLANVASSVSENAARGKHPFAQIGYSIGPFRLRVSIPALDPNADSYSYVDVFADEAASLIREYNASDSVHFRGGMVAFERRTLYPSREGIGPFSGYTIGIFPGVWEQSVPAVWHHEVIHAIQSLQTDAVEPSFQALTLHRDPAVRRRLIRFESLKLGIVNAANGLATSSQRYEDRWTEIEAYRLAERRAP